jgi:amino acid transporter
MSTIPPDAPSDSAPKRQLTLFDSTCIIVGIIIGAGIYQTAPHVAQGAGCSWRVFLFWAAGGVLSLCGALNYAELAAAYPEEGGDYVYLSRAYGRWAGFLFGWMQLAVVRPGDIAGMAFVFAVYAAQIYNPLRGAAESYAPQVYAAMAVAVFTLINVWGVRQGKWTQNVLTVAKALGLLAIVVVALVAPRERDAVQAATGFPPSVALILVLFTYGGWNEMAYVAAEVKDPKRNIVRALVLGTAAVTALYLLVNGAFLYTLGYAGLTNSGVVAADAIATVFTTTGPRLISALVCISALGAVNGLVFTGARISYAIGADHRAFRLLGRWDPRQGTPARALLLQGVLAIGLIAALGSFIEAIIYTAAAVYLFYLATSLAVIVLRWKEPHVERPYRVTGYPVTTLIFCAVCAFLIYGAISYKPLISTIALGIIFLGLPIYWLTPRHGAPCHTDDHANGSNTPGTGIG